MKHHFVWAMLLLIFSISAHAQIPMEAIRVRLEKSQQEYSFEGVGVQIFGRSGIEKISLPQMQKIKISRVLVDGKKLWRVVRSFGNKVQTELFSESTLAFKAIHARKKGQLIPTQMMLWPQGSQNFDVIAVLPLEEYLVGVLAGEMPSAWPLETLKAQAIAARSYALSVMSDRQSQSFHVENTVMDQVYRAPAGQGKKTWQAVKETENLVLVGQKNKIFKSFFHSDCGGQTASARDVWGQGVGTSVVADSSCPLNPKASWIYRITQAKLNQAMNAFASKEAGPLQSLEISKGGGENRALEISLTWKNGEQKEILAQDFRQILGFEKLKSTFFRIQQYKNEYIFSGVGYGHGVGLCQWGARALGIAGKNYIEILKHYYPQANLYFRSYQVPETKIPQLRLGLLKQKSQL